MSDPKLHANLRAVDDRRSLRLVLAWMTGDKLALDAVLSEASAEPAGNPGLLFALTTYAASLTERAIPNAADFLRAELLRAVGEDGDDD